MRISRFDESKKKSSKKEKDLSAQPFDAESTLQDKDVVGFRTQNEEMPKAAEKKLKKEIQVTTPGLKKSIKKFEEFAIIIDLGGEPEVGTNVPDQVDCECGCEDCECSTSNDLPVEDSCDTCDDTPTTDDTIIPFDLFGGLSEKLEYHLNNGLSVVENVFRPGSDSFINLIKEARNAHDSGKVKLNKLDSHLFESTDLGRFAKFNGKSVPLDLPLETIEEMNEAEYHGKKVELNHPMRGGTKKYHVYVKNPKTGKVKKIAFGDVHGGLTAKVSDPKARKNFAARHNCKDKKDKTKAGYWACRINKYAHLWNGRTYPGYW
jgi:hypothetical protein